MRRLAFAVLTFTAACGQQAPPPVNAGAAAIVPVPPVPAAVALDPAMGAILSEAKAASLAKQCSRVSPRPVSGTWTPKSADIAALEAGLGSELATQLLPEAGAKPEDYYRQYAGLVIGGREIIYVNGIHRDAVDRAPEDLRNAWRTEPSMICDGGTITFGVEFNPATKRFSNFAFNGRI